MALILHPLVCRRSLVAAAVVAVAMLPAGLCRAQDAPFLVSSWQTDQGLPNNTVEAITQTRDGYLWLGTDSGLVRFDGMHCRVYGLQDGLSSLQISALVQESSGALWVGTAGGGLNRFREGKIQNFTTHDGLSGNSIQALLETTNHEIWVGTPTGLSRWQGGRFETLAPELGPIFVYDLAQDSRGDVWVATLHQHLVRFYAGRPEMLRPPGVRDFDPRCVMVDRQDRVWAGARQGYVGCYENGAWTLYGTNQGLPVVVLNRLAQAPDGTIWVGSLNEGLYYLRDGTFQPLQTKDGLPDDAVLSLRGGHQFLWAGTQSGGLSRIGPRRLSVVHAMEGASECQLRSLAEDAQGQVWVATYGQALYRWTDDRVEPIQGLPFRAHAIVEAVLEAGDGSLWWGAGPSLFHWQAGQVLYSHEEGWLKGDRAWSLCDDREGGVWVGTYNGQLGHLRGKVFTQVKGLSDRPVTSLVMETNGTLWFGTLGGGLGRLAKGKLKVFTTRDGLHSNLIRTLFLDEEGVLWIGTDGGGLSRWKDGRLATFTSERGLVDDTILQILGDDDGSLWLGSNHGICRVYKRALNDVAEGRAATVHTLVFGRADGMTSEACVGNFGAALKTRDGRLCFSTAKGIVVIDPRHQANTLAPPAVLLESVLVDGRPLPALPELAGPGTVERAAAGENPVLEVTPGRHAFEFRFTGISFEAPERLRFRYQLQGLDERWTDVGNLRVAHYSYVPPGEYCFQVKACNGNDIWSPDVAALRFVVLPNFWQTAWFKILLVGGVLGLTGVTIRYVERRRYRARLRRLEQERARNQERERIARDLHDELGSSLNYISMSVSDLGQSRETDAERLKARLAKISGFTVRTARSLDEIVWAVNPRYDSLRSLVEYLTQLARELFEDTSVRCRFQIQEDLPQVPLAPEMRHHLFLVVKEAINNVLKHAQATEVVMSAAISGPAVELVIKDNGAGFDPAAVEARTERNGIKNMRQRLAALGGRFTVESAPGAGTVIRLVFDYSPAAPPPARLGWLRRRFPFAKSNGQPQAPKPE